VDLNQRKFAVKSVENLRVVLPARAQSARIAMLGAERARGVGCRLIVRNERDRVIGLATLERRAASQPLGGVSVQAIDVRSDRIESQIPVHDSGSPI
jgi:hypothetical protein